MAKVTLTIEDHADEDGCEGVSFHLASVPPFPGPAAEDQSTTPAQQIASHLVAMIAEAQATMPTENGE